MSYTPKTWKDYPDTSTPITAAELTRIETGISDAYDNMALYVKDPFISMFPEYTYTGIPVIISNGSTLLDSPPTYKIPAADFDPTKDGIMIWVNTNTPVYSNYYSFSSATIDGTDYVVITFNETTTALFTIGSQVMFMLFEKPPDSGGETAVVNGYLPDHRYFITPILFDGTGLTSYEICICFRATVHPTRANAFCGGEHDYYRCPSCEMNPQGVWHGFAYDGSWSWQYDEFVQWADMPVEIDFTGAMQWIKLSWDSTEQKQVLSHSLDGVTFTEISSIATPPTAYIPSGDAHKITLGNVSVISADHPFEVGNDINIFNSYIKMNGTLVFGREVTA